MHDSKGCPCFILGLCTASGIWLHWIALTNSEATFKINSSRPIALTNSEATFHTGQLSKSIFNTRSLQHPFTSWYSKALEEGIPLVDGEGSPLISMNVTLPDGRAIVVPIEQLYPNLRSGKFEELLQKNTLADVNSDDGAFSNYLWNVVNAETRSYPVFLPKFVDVVNLYQRRIFIDLGAGTWDTGTFLASGSNFDKYFGTRFPSTESPWANTGILDELIEIDYVPSLSPGIPIISKAHNTTTTFMNRRIVSWSQGAGRTSTDHDLDIVSFLKTVSSPHDYVCLKMDIENYEWLVVPDMEKSGAFDLVDELIIEVHFMTDDPKWQGFIKRASLKQLVTNEGGSHTREQAFDLISKLRERGVYAHTYP